MAVNKGSKKNSALQKNYLILYNGVQTVGWIYLFLKFMYYYMDSSFNKPTLYESLKCPLFVFQNLAVLEIAHALFRLVPSNPLVTLMQVFSRVFVVCAILAPTETARESTGLPLLLFAWTMTEIVRYSNYMLNLINVVPYFLIWLRYSTFIILYPIGITGELLCLYAAYLEYSETQMWSSFLPNKLNFTFIFPYIVLLVMFSYIPLFPQLYLHMVSQRRKVLGKGKEKKQ